MARRRSVMESLMSVNRQRRLAMLTRGAYQVTTLRGLLDDCTLVLRRRPQPMAVDGVLAWGRKLSAQVALRFAGRHGLPLLYLEDGFLRSVGLGSQDPPLSLVVDDLGIYYDATQPSALNP